MKKPKRRLRCAALLADSNGKLRRCGVSARWCEVEIADKATTIWGKVGEGRCYVSWASIPLCKLHRGEDV